MNEALSADISKLFDIHAAAPEGTERSFRAAELASSEGMERFLVQYAPLMRAIDKQAPGAYFANWFANAALALQFALARYNTVLDFGLSNLHLHLIPAKGYCRIAWSLDAWTETPLPEAEPMRSNRLRLELENFYRNTAAPLLQEASRATGLSLGNAWGQLPTRFNYYDSLLPAGDEDDAAVCFRNSYSILKDLSPSWFDYSRNPFQAKIRYTEDIAEPGKSVMIRNRCCLYYCTEGGSLCYICPRLTEEERSRRRVEYRQKAAGTFSE